MFNNKLKAQLLACQMQVGELQGFVDAVKGGVATRAGAYFDFECFLLKNGALYFITQQKKSFFSEIFNVVRLMDEKQTKYAPALGWRPSSSLRMAVFWRPMSLS